MPSTSHWNKEFSAAALASKGWMILTSDDRAVLADAMTTPDIQELSIAVPGLEQVLRDERCILDVGEILMLKELAEIHDQRAVGIRALHCDARHGGRQLRLFRQMKTAGGKQGDQQQENGDTTMVHDQLHARLKTKHSRSPCGLWQV